MCGLFSLRLISNVGSVVEFSPATREARVRFPDVASFACKASFSRSSATLVVFLMENLADESEVQGGPI